MQIFDENIRWQQLSTCSYVDEVQTERSTDISEFDMVACAPQSSLSISESSDL